MKNNSVKVQNELYYNHFHFVPKKNYFYYEFAVDGKVVSNGSCLFTKPKHFAFENPKLKVLAKGNEITVSASAYAKFVKISNKDDDLVLSDNYFDMNKGKVTVKVVSGSVKGLSATSVYDVR